MVGYWNGNVKIQQHDMTIPVLFKVVSENQIFIDIPSQGVNNEAMENVVLENGKLKFTMLGSTPGMCRFELGTKKDDQGFVYGSFTQFGVYGTMKLSEGMPEVQEDENRIVEYGESEVTIEMVGGVVISGTLTTPYEALDEAKLVVLVPGSGAWTRDEAVGDFMVFKELAHELSNSGVHVFRYDERGVGKSVGDRSDATTYTFADDAIGICEYFKKSEEYKEISSIGILGHSEGGLAGMIVAEKYNDLAFLIGISTPTICGYEVMLKQTRDISKVHGHSDQVIEAEIVEKNLLFNCLRTDNPTWEELMEHYRAKIRENLQPHMGKLQPEQVEVIIEGHLSEMNSLGRVWLKSFIDFNPITHLQNLSVPMLLLYGDLDLQVNAKMSIDRLEKLEEDKNELIKVITIPTANHLFQSAKTGSPTEYPKLEKQFAKGFIPSITSFLKNNKLD